MMIERIKLLVLVFAVAMLGVLTPGCYADWVFVRDARNNVEPKLQQQLRAAQDEIQKLKAQLKGDAK